MSKSHRLSIQSAPSPPPEIVPDAESDKWFRNAPVTAKGLMDIPLFSIEADSPVEKACEALLAQDISVLAIGESSTSTTHIGLFDWNDVNAFLVVAVKSHNMRPDDVEHPRVTAIINAAREGEVPVRLASDLSEKNPFQTLPPDASLLSLLSIFSRGTRRVVVTNSSGDSLGIASDRSLVSWFMQHAPDNPTLATALQSPLSALGVEPKLVVSLSSNDTILDAMQLMSEEGVSSVAVVDHEGMLLSVVSVTDIGKLVLPSQSRKILSTPLHQFVTQIKAEHGSTDGADKFPVYSVSLSSTLSFTIQKLLATNAHRVFITDDGIQNPSPGGNLGNLRGVFSVVDVLSIFARYAGLPDVDPSRVRHRRRTSSVSSHSRSSSYTRSESTSLRTRSSVSSLSAPSAPIPIGTCVNIGGAGVGIGGPGLGLDSATAAFLSSSSSPRVTMATLASSPTARELSVGHPSPTFNAFKIKRMSWSNGGGIDRKSGQI